MMVCLVLGIHSWLAYPDDESASAMKNGAVHGIL